MVVLRPLTRVALARHAYQGPALRCRQVRLQSSSAVASASQASSGNSSFAAGLAGGIIGSLIMYGVYYVSPAGKTQRVINSAAKQANDKYQAAAKKLQENAPTADQAIDSIKQFAYNYVGWFPGGRSLVDTVFKDIETVRESQSEEADKLVNDAYKQLRDVAKSGLSLATLSKAFDVFTDLSQKAAGLAGNAASDILDNHPELKEQLGGSIDELKKLGEQYGPEAKRQVEETWQDIKGIIAGGLTASNIDKARKVIDKKMEQVKKFGDEAWTKGLEEARPLLEKNPKVKELIEKNASLLKQGNAKEIFDNVKSAVESGDVGKLEKYAKSVTDTAKSKGFDITSNLGDVDKYAKMIPGGEEMVPKLQKLRAVADKHKEEGEKLFNETIEELKQVLEKKAKKAEEIVSRAKDEAK